MTMETQRQAMAEVAAAFERVQLDGRTVLFECQNGVVLRCKAVSPVYMQALAEQFLPPPPPKRIINNGQDEPWEEENPGDPAYQRQLADLDRRWTMALNRLLAGMGTEPVTIPDGIFGPDDDGWIEQVRRAELFTGVAIPVDISTPEMRYISWLFYYVFDNNVDLSLTGMFTQQLGGLQEGEIAKAIETFRGLLGRRTDPGSANGHQDSNGAGPNRAQRRAR